LAALLLEDRVLLFFSFALLLFSLALATSSNPKASSSVEALRICAVTDFGFLKVAGRAGLATGGAKEAAVTDTWRASSGARLLPTSIPGWKGW